VGVGVGVGMIEEFFGNSIKFSFKFISSTKICNIWSNKHILLYKTTFDSIASINPGIQVIVWVVISVFDRLILKLLKSFNDSEFEHVEYNSHW